MKITRTILSSLLALSVAALAADAGIVFQDNFNYPNGILNTASGGVWGAGPGNTNNSAISIVNGLAQIAGTSTSYLPRAYFTNGIGFITNGLANTNTTTGVVSFTNAVGYFPSNSPEPALYASYTLNVTQPPSAGNTYFAYFTDTSFDFRCRQFIATNGAAAGFYRVGVEGYSSPSSATNIVQQDLTFGTTYTVVVRYVLSSGLATMWVNPASETNSATNIAVTATGTVNLGGVGATTNLSTCGFGLRNATGTGLLNFGNLVVGTQFADVVPGSLNPPTILTQPQPYPYGFVGASASFSTFAIGDTNITYQWYFNTNSLLTDQTNATLTLTNLYLTNAGYYSVVASNTAGVSTSSFALLTVYAQAIAPVITNEPVNATYNQGDTAVFTVVAGGVPPPSYQWKFVTNNVTNTISGATSATLSVATVTTNLTGYSYFVTITNVAGTTNSSLATLTVNPPVVTTIAGLHAVQSTTTWLPTNTTTIYVVQGTVTTWTDMTSSGSSEFYIQDATGGVCVFWDNARSSTNLPPAGALVRVTAPLTSFDGLLEMEPVFGNALNSVVILSSNNPLPTPQTLPFDPNIQNDYAVMESLVGSYFVASNVFLNLTTPTFVSDVDEPITNVLTTSATDAQYGLTFTNGAGQTFIYYNNEYTDILGQNKPTGPVTIFGVLGQFVTTSPYEGGYEFTPSRFADIITYVHWTNVISNQSRAGDLATNSYSQSVLRPGEGLTMNVSLGDPAGGIVALTPLSNTFSPRAYWTNVVQGGTTATAEFVFNPTALDAGSNYIVTMVESNTDGFTTNTWSVYVPLAYEQQIFISEFLANPTTVTNAHYFNPLHRAHDTNNIAANDQYIEIANLSTNTVDLFNWSINVGPATVHQFFNGEAGGEVLNSSNAIIVYGGLLNADPNPPVLPVLDFPADYGDSPGLALPTSGTGAITLLDGNGNIVDRVVYSGGSLITNGSLSRFPWITNGFVSQGYISTNFTSAGLQYNGAAWNAAAPSPTSVLVTGISAGKPNPVSIGFTANTGKASTLWSTGDLGIPFSVLTGQQFTNASAMFTITNAPATQQFYFITTQ